MKKILSNEYLILLFRIVAGFIFLSFGLEKIFDPQKFAKEIANYQLLPDVLLNISAIFLPWIELIAGLFLIAGIRLKANSVIIGGLLIVFIMAVSTAMARGLNIQCGCSSSHAQVVGFPKIFENLGLLFMISMIYMFPSKKLSFDSLAKIENN